MISLPVSAWLPIRTPAWDHPERLDTYFLARDQFIAQLPAAVSTLTDMVTVYDVKLAEPSSELLDWFKQKSFMAGTRLFEFIFVEGTAQIDARWHAENPGVEDSILRGVAVLELGDVLELTLLLTELAYPGCIDTLDGALFSETHFTNAFRKKGAHFRLGFPEQHDPWPAVRSIELTTVVSWAKRLNFHRQSLAESRVERALAAYSHIVGLSWQRDGELLFRAMQGLEAFYIDGTGDLRRQLSTKVQLWLGNWVGSKNVVGHLYDLRSAFVHGSSKLAYWNKDGAAWDDDEDHMKRFESSVDLSIRLLVATLQECINRQVKVIDWSYSYETDERSQGGPATPDA